MKSADNLFDKHRKAVAKTRKPAAKRYRNPNNPEEAWSGRGRQPRWLAVALTSVGAKLEDFEV
jgi:DNA-binding protein H-NS